MAETASHLEEPITDHIQQLLNSNGLATITKEDTAVVIDTNILMHKIHTVEALFLRGDNVQMMLPYAVLIELDKLKTSTVKHKRTNAKSAIKYIRKCFVEKNSKFKAQGAIEHATNLIEITSLDDKIINCCLQIQPNVQQVILLTEDANFQNKSEATHIAVCTAKNVLKFLNGINSSSLASI